ncbi:MAG: NUDIX domain-containing protein [Bacilli bacterium]|nr:NUDIX domain-containing protein [Bacilli bacterium]
MNTKNILEEIKKLSNTEKRNLEYEKLIQIVEQLTSDEIIELSNIIGYPVFTRLCMGVLKHKFILLQDGAAAIIVNKQGQILLQARADRDKWGLPGGCQELGERFEDTIIREVKEETNLDINEENLELIGIVSGSSRRNEYPNGDVVLNNTALYCVRNYTGTLKWDVESKEMKFFDLEKLPENQNDPDLIEVYRRYLNKENKELIKNR